MQPDEQLFDLPAVPEGSLYVSVAVPAAVPGLFTYSVPKDSNIAPGCRVLVSFNGRVCIGVCVRVMDERPDDGFEGAILPVKEQLDDKPVMNDDVISLCLFMAGYYHGCEGEIFETALPVALRSGEPVRKKAEPAFRLVKGADITRIKNEKQKAAVSFLFDGAVISRRQLTAAGIESTALNALVTKGIAEKLDLRSLQPDWRTIPDPVNEQDRKELNDEQRAAVSAISESDGFGVFLLEGVTGSGKTEVYLQLIEDVVKSGGQALVMVPEISLTPQTVARFLRRFRVPVAVTHSGLNAPDRLDAYLSMSDGSAAVIVGTRSALFTPFKDLRLIIVDEEHDESYKQDDGCRYNGRDLAVFRGTLAKCPVVLGSATPSFESLANAMSGRYRLLRLTRRAGEAAEGHVTRKIIDVRGTRLAAGLSPALINMARRELDEGHQVLFFLNRRGFAPVMVCADCGHVFGCPNCDSHLTYHREQNHRVCHHCEAFFRPPERCPACGSSNLTVLGVGTERLQAAAEKLFPGYPVIRIDHDTTKRRGSLEEAVDGIRAGKYRVIIGTQIVAKGHDFPNVTLAAILNIDSALFSEDFRAEEELAALYTQVAGRTGRSALPCTVAVQSFYPDHAVLQTIVSKGYDAFAAEALPQRQGMSLPPYSRQALLRFESQNSDDVMAFAENAFRIVEESLEEGVTAEHPVPARMEKLAGRYRALIMLTSPARKPLHRTLSAIGPLIRKLPGCGIVKWSVDVDPRSVLD